MRAVDTSGDDVMDYRGLSVYLKMSPGALRHKVMRGIIPYVKIGRSVRFAKKDIDVWLKIHRKELQQSNVGKISDELVSAGGSES